MSAWRRLLTCIAVIALGFLVHPVLGIVLWCSIALVYVFAWLMLTQVSRDR